MSNFASRVSAALKGTINTLATSSATPAAIERRVRDAKERIAELERQHAIACLDWLDRNDASKRDQLAAEIAAVRTDLSALEVALKASHERIAAEGRARASSLHASRVHSATMHLRAAEKHAAALADALTKAAEARRGLLASSAKGRAAAPIPLPRGSLTESALLDRLIANELHRVSFEKKTGSLPGSVSPSILTKEDPEAITPLADQLRQAHDFAIGVMRNEIAAPQTPAGIVTSAADATASQREPIADPPEVDTDALGPFVAPDLQPQKLSLTG